MPQLPKPSPVSDPYRRCLDVCTHDLARGVLVSDLLRETGPYTDVHPLLVYRAYPTPQRSEMVAVA